MQVKLHKRQYEVATDPHKYKVICAGRQWGKSVLARLVCIQWATKTPGGIFWIVSPTFVQGKQNHWRRLQLEIPPEWILKKNEVELSITLKNGSTIYLKSAENPDALRGATINGLVIDEIASIRNWEWLWEQAIGGTLIVNDAPVIFISTPKGFNHFHQLYERGLSKEEDNPYKSWRFTSYDNPHVKAEVIDAKRKELTEDTFAQEYLADFRKFTGLVYKEFDRQVHVVEPFDIPDSWSIYRGLDFGSTNPTACLWVAVDGDDNWFVAGEYYDTRNEISTHAGFINAHPLSRRVSTSYGDPSGAQWITEFGAKGVYITPATKEIGQAFTTWVTFGIDKVSQKLKRVPGKTTAAATVSSGSQGGQPSLYVFSSCTNTIREFETYRWKEKSVTAAQDLNEPDQVEKANDHAMDALRYFAVSYQKQGALILPPRPKPHDSVIGI